ncbi:MAG: type I 3-dehydroquinate dehydratase [Planctomycetota bacterium]|jgi:3-dehydroquinate dehydratase/shikimate dehydrogenase
MLVISLTSRDLRSLASDAGQAFALGAGAVEVRADFLKDPDPRKAREAVNGVAVYTLRSSAEGGRWEGERTKQRALLLDAARAGFEYVDVEFHSGVDPADLPSRCILSLHDFEGVPADLESTVGAMVSRSPFAAKAVCRARDLEVELRLLELQKNLGAPAAVFAMGPSSLASRVLAPKFGAPLVYAALGPGNEAAPGQPDGKTLLETYGIEGIGPATEVFGLAGHPLGHSLSPAFHNRRFREGSRDAVYVPFDTDDFGALWNRRELLDLRGLSVTLPHKEAALSAADRARSPAPEAGCANTLTREEGAWIADNTDVGGVKDALAEKGVSLAGRDVLVLGAGGAARAVCRAVTELGGRTTVAARSVAKARELAEVFGGAGTELGEADPSSFALVVNATPVGMEPREAETVLDPSRLSPGQAVFDLVYTPEETALLRGAGKRGCTTVSGMALFVRQAERQQAIWGGVEGS